MISSDEANNTIDYHKILGRPQRNNNKQNTIDWSLLAASRRKWTQRIVFVSFFIPLRIALLMLLLHKGGEGELPSNLRAGYRSLLLVHTFFRISHFKTNTWELLHTEYTEPKKRNTKNRRIYNVPLQTTWQLGAIDPSHFPRHTLGYILD